MLKLECPRGLQEADFLQLLKSTFPQLSADNQHFDILTSDKKRRLQPLKLKTVTPEEIHSNLSCTGWEKSTIYIRLKVGNLWFSLLLLGIFQSITLFPSMDPHWIWPLFLSKHIRSFRKRLIRVKTPTPKPLSPPLSGWYVMKNSFKQGNCERLNVHYVAKSMRPYVMFDYVIPKPWAWTCCYDDLHSYR